METVLKKHFWLVHVAVIVTCSLLAARGLNHWIEGKYLLGSASAKPGAARRPPRVADKPKAAPTTVKDGAIVASRNVFCSTCEPAQPEPTAAAPQVASDPNQPPATSLPLALLGTFVTRQPELRSATIVNTQSQKSGAYWIHEEIPDVGEIVRVEPRFVDFRNLALNRVERLDLLGVPPAAPPKVAAAPQPTPTAPAGDDFLAAVDQGVKKIDDTHYEVSRGLVDRVLGDPNLVARSARIVPSIKDGKANGFKMYAIRPNSVYAKIGFQNGDTLHAVNGFEITSPDKALEVYTKVKSASHLSIEVTRRGQNLSLDYTIK